MKIQITYQKMNDTDGGEDFAVGEEFILEFNNKQEQFHYELNQAGHPWLYLKIIDVAYIFDDVETDTLVDIRMEHRLAWAAALPPGEQKTGWQTFYGIYYNSAESKKICHVF